MDEMFKLGAILRKRYVLGHQFLSKRYTPKEVVSIVIIQ